MLLGIHHLTALAGDPQRNLDFYTQFLGLRLVKRTVNFDDPGTYHFYFGDQTGTPGTLLTFFPWPTAPVGRAGAGQIPAASFAVPRGSLARWIERASRARVEWLGPETRFGEEMITLRDPAGLPVELIASEPEDGASGIVRLHSVSIVVSDASRSARFLTETFGCHFVSEDEDRTRFELAGSPVDVIEAPGVEPARLSAGMMHHAAFRVADESAQNQWREKLMAAGMRVTRVIDRQYFRSIYFREPGGVLFEIATAGPGFLIDEPAAELGHSLKLPPWLEKTRDSIERRLTPVHVETNRPREEPPEAANP